MSLDWAVDGLGTTSVGDVAVTVLGHLESTLHCFVAEGHRQRQVSHWVWVTVRGPIGSVTFPKRNHYSIVVDDGIQPMDFQVVAASKVYFQDWIYCPYYRRVHDHAMTVVVAAAVEAETTTTMWILPTRVDEAIDCAWAAVRFVAHLALQRFAHIFPGCDRD